MKQSINKPKYIKANVHRCRHDFIFVIPRQKMSDEDVEKYIIKLKNDGGWGETRWTVDDTIKTDVVYCPYCGELLVEEEDMTN